MLEEGVILPVDEHSIEVLGQFLIYVEFQDVRFVGQLFKVAEGHFLVGSTIMLLLFQLRQDVVVVIIKELLNLHKLSLIRDIYLTFRVYSYDRPKKVRMLPLLKHFLQHPR